MRKKGLFILLGLVCIAVVAGSGVLVINRDKTGPEIVVSEDRKIVYETEDDKAALLEGVTAVDEKDGDVSKSLRVESVQKNEDGSLEVTYSAVDHSNNATKLTCKVETVDQPEQETEDEQEPQEEIVKAPEEENQEEAGESEQQEQQPEGENQQSEENQQQSEETPEDDNSDTEAAIAALPEGSPQLRLSTHHVDLQVGSSFQYMDYIESMTDDKDDTSALSRKIYLQGEVNTAQVGDYTISYYVTDSDQHQSNVETLTVTVHE